MQHYESVNECLEWHEGEKMILKNYLNEIFKIKVFIRDLFVHIIIYFLN